MNWDGLDARSKYRLSAFVYHLLYFLIIIDG